jgi:hypothetical protein
MTPTELVDSLDSGFCHWFAGFSNGEGCFLVYKRPVRHDLKCIFSLNQRYDDTSTLVMIQTTLHIGYMRATNCKSNSRPGAKPQSILRVEDYNGCIVLRELFNRYDLRGKKKNDFKIWAEAVRVWGNTLMCRGSGRLNREIVKNYNEIHVWSKMLELKRQLESGRKYISPEVV